MELTLDDDDELSLDSSRDVSRRADSVDEREHDTSSYYEDESPVKQPVRANAVETSRSALTTTVAKAEATVRPFRADSDQDNDYDERDDKKGDAPPPYSAPAVAAAVSAPAYASANQWNPTAAAATRHGDSDGEEEHSIEAESVASQSEILESQDQSDYREAQPVASRPTRAIAMEQSAPSESGVYEEEVFEEESVPTSPDSRPAVRQPLVEPNQASPLPSVTATKTEPTFDYSMNFSDDGDTDRQAPASASVGPLPAASSVRAEPTVSDADDDYESEGERSALLESDDNSHESQPGDGPPPVSSSAPPASATASPPYNAPTDAEAEYSDELVPSLGGHSAAKLVPVATIGSGKTAETDKQREEVKRPQLSAKSAASDENEGSDNAAATREEDHVTGHASQSQQGVRATKTSNARLQPSTRPKVVIVRAYEASSAEKPEMRDASTQFTGNHAGIQTELVPDGMHNLQEPQRSVPAAYVEQDLGRETFESATRTTPPPPPLQPPPAPTVQPTAGSLPLPSYSLNMLHQPLAASTSLYKQQLLALQEQIRQKKRETERLVSERMSFQYGSLRGTERVGDAYDRVCCRRLTILL